MNTNIKQCLRKVADGHFTADVKVLGSSGVTPYNEDTMKVLEEKHLYMPPPTTPTTMFIEAPLVVEVDNILKCIQSFPKGTSCGRDGLRAQHLLDATYGEGSPVARDLLDDITLVVNLWPGGRCPNSLSEFVAFAPSTLLLKSDGGIRPIAVATIWRRLVYKVAMKGVGKDMAKYLNDPNLGSEYQAVHRLFCTVSNRVLSRRHEDGSLAMLIVDFSNAFNMVDRSALLQEVRVRCPSISLWVEFHYGQAARLYLGNKHIMAAARVQQGDPSEPLFSLLCYTLSSIRSESVLVTSFFMLGISIIGLS
jgi:hypothetical protein